MTIDIYLNTKQAAKTYGLSVSYLTKLRLTGDGAKYLKIGKRVIYRKSDFQNWLDSHIQTSTSDTSTTTEA